MNILVSPCYSKSFYRNNKILVVCKNRQYKLYAQQHLTFSAKICV